MQEVYPPVPLKSPGKVALREGVILGLIVGGLHLVLSILEYFIPNDAIALLILLLQVIIWPSAFFIAGMRAAKRTGRVSTGTLAGLWTGVIGGAIGTVVNFVIGLIDIDATRQSLEAALQQSQASGIQITNQMVIALNALGGICLLLIGIGLGAGIGALGGLRGRSQSPLRSAPYPPFPPPAPGQPPFYPPPPIE